MITIFGVVDTIEVMPVMKFEGLYEKRGDTVIWFTDDQCRVPVKISSKLLIGSLTSKLVAWENSHCQKYRKIERKRGKSSCFGGRSVINAISELVRLGRDIKKFSKNV